MPFTHPVPDWNAQGAEPPESLKTAGWGINQKPPADYFNWFFYNTAKAIIELQLEAINIDQKGAPDGLATLGADGKVPASQLNVSAPPDASTTVKGVVQLSNSTTSTSETLAATPKAVKDAKDGLSAQIGILSGLNTTAKDNLVNAVNELFTSANNGKTNLATVIGSPATASDTFARLAELISTDGSSLRSTIGVPSSLSVVTEVKNSKANLAEKLVNKGVSASSTENLYALTEKVANIETGPKFATGSITLNPRLNITQQTISLGITFVPHVFVVYSTSASSEVIGADVKLQRPLAVFFKANGFANTSGTDVTLNSSARSVNGTEFVQFSIATVSQAESKVLFRFSSGTQSATTMDMSWIALGQ